MDRRRVLLIVAVVVAVLGAALVFLYARGADNRAEQRFDTVEVLEASAVINPGESVEDAQNNAKFVSVSIPQDQMLPTAQLDTTALAGQVALTTIYPGEQIITEKFGQTAAVQSNLQIPKGQVAISVNLTDPARVAGFVNPGSSVSIFYVGQGGTNEGAADAADAGGASNGTIVRMLLPRVTVLGVGSTTPVSTTTTDETGIQTTEQLPRTLMTIAVDQDRAERVLWSNANAELAFALLTPDSTVDQDDAATTYGKLFLPLADNPPAA